MKQIRPYNQQGEIFGVLETTVSVKNTIQRAKYRARAQTPGTRSTQPALSVENLKTTVKVKIQWRESKTASMCP